MRCVAVLVGVALLGAAPPARGVGLEPPGDDPSDLPLRIPWPRQDAPAAVAVVSREASCRARCGPSTGSAPRWPTPWPMRGWWLPLTTPQLLGRQLPRDPRHRARGTLSLLAGCCHVTVHARADSVAFDDDRHTDSMAGTMAFDLFAAITMGGPWQAFATVQNVLDPPVLALAGVRLR